MFARLRAYIRRIGYASNPDDLRDAERSVLERRPLQRYPLEHVQGKVRQAAAEALVSVEGRKFVVHFDVDVIDFVDFPVADVPQFNTGLTFQEAMDCLAVFASSPWFAGLVITEFNPDHADEEGVLALALVQGLAHALAH